MGRWGVDKEGEREERLLSGWGGGVSKCVYIVFLVTLVWVGLG